MFAHDPHTKIFNAFKGLHLKSQDSMLARHFAIARTELAINRLFSIGLRCFAAPAKKDKREEARESSRRLMKRRIENKAPPNKHPLYMDVPTAMRYLRAAEVGKAPEKTTVSAHISLVSTKSSAPLQGKIFFPKQLKDTHALVFVNDPAKQEELRSLSSNITVGGSDLIAQVQEGDFDFSKYNQCYAHPDIVSQLKSVARILGPRKMMPLEKKGTVSSNIRELVMENFGAYYFKGNKDSIAFPVGRCDFSDEEIIKNLKAASEAIYSCQPAGTKDPVLIGRCHLSTTLGPSIVIDFRS